MSGPRRMLLMLLFGVAVWLVLSVFFMWPPVCREEQIHRATAPCQNNLRQISAVTEQFAQGHAGKIPLLADLVPDLIKEQPVCPDGGTYIIPSPGMDASCSFATNRQAKKRADLFHWRRGPIPDHTI